MSEELETVRAGGKAAVARALAELERGATQAANLTLLEQAWAAGLEGQGAHAIGLTGPPGVGKSTLLSALVAGLRARGKTVAVLAVDPSSKRTGGALLGDRTRIEVDPEDAGVYVRSLAARDRLGGLADDAVAASVLMRALYDVVLIETVGVGQSETDVAELADTVLFAVQPASGDSLQYMKAGIVEIPDLAVVTKADLGAVAERARRDLEHSLRVHGASTGRTWQPQVILVSAPEARGIPRLLDLLEERWQAIQPNLRAKRRAQAASWLAWFVKDGWGRKGLQQSEGLRLRAKEEGGSPFAWLAKAEELLGR